MSERTMTFYPAGHGSPGFQRVHLGTSPGTLVGLVRRGDTGKWAAQRPGCDEWMTGFITEVRAGQWLADRWLERGTTP